MTSRKRPTEWETVATINATGKDVKIVCNSVFDTGAQKTIISNDARLAIKAEKAGQIKNKMPDGEEITNTCFIDIEFENGVKLQNIEAIITKHDIKCAIAFGMNVITLGDFHSFRDSDGLYKCTFSLYP